MNRPLAWLGSTPPTDTNSCGDSGPKAYAAALASYGLYAAGNGFTQLGSLVLS